MNRHALTDCQWETISYLLPTGPRRPSRLGTGQFLDAVTWLSETVVSWRDPPEQFGNWKTVYTRFWRWAHRGLWRLCFTLWPSVRTRWALCSTHLSCAHTKIPVAAEAGQKKTHRDVVVVDSRPRHMRL
ncbi:MAG: transposase [Oxalobacteraceae bacterium]|nr:MAG: transposase [Oxalobacteraceae bacterium]